MTSVDGPSGVHVLSEVGPGEPYGLNVEGDVNLLEDADFGGDPMFELQALMTKLNFEDRKSSRETRLKEEEAFRDALTRSVKALKDEASARKWAAICNSIGQGAAAAGAAFGGTNGREGLLGDPTAATLTQLGGSGLQSLSTLMVGGFEEDAKNAEARSTQAKGDQSLAERAIEDARDSASDAQDAYRKTIERFEEIIMAEEKVAQAAIRG